MPLNKAEALRHAEQFVARGKVPAAIAVYHKIVEADPLDLTAICALGDLYVSDGQTPAALEHYSAIADKFIKQGASVKAAYILRKILELDPANPNVQLGLAELYSQEGMIEKAHSAFIEAASSFARAGKTSEALDANKRALAVKPDSQQAREALIALEAQAVPVAPATTSRETPGAVEPNAGAPAAPSQDSGPVDNAPDFDDRMVIKSISKAELLAGYGDVEQALALLKNVAAHRPDSIDVHVKLKDIYLRNEMIEEAERECLQIANLYDSRGDSERARDFTIRANRLSQLIKPSSAPRTVVESALENPPPTIGSVEQIPSSEPARSIRPQPPRVPAVPPVRTSGSLPARAGAGTYSLPPVAEVVAAPPTTADNPEPVEISSNSQVSIFDAEPAPLAAAQPEPVLFKQYATTALATLGGGEAPSSRRRWVMLSLTAVTIAALSVGAVWVALPIYEAKLDKEYAAIASAQAIAAPPSEPAPVEEEPSAPTEQVDVPANEPAPVETQPPGRNEAERLRQLEEERRNKKQREVSNVVPRTTPAVAQPSPNAAANKRSPMAPPSVGAVQGGSDGSTPLDVSSVPGGAARPGEAPAPAPRATVPTRAESVRQVRPTYPSIAKSSGQRGVVTVEVSINDRGDVVSARAVSGPTLLRESAVAAASRWKFKPATRDGKPVSSVTTISFNFRL